MEGFDKSPASCSKLDLVEFQEVIGKNKTPIAIGLFGLLFVGGAILLFSLNGEEPPTVEIVSEEKEAKTIFVDLEGAIERPGVYEMPFGSRVGDLLTKAGGLSASADREWSAKNLNLAQKLADGVKIYIPKKNGAGLASENILSASAASENTSINSSININTASTQELDALWGIGEKRVQDIVANRPYQTIEELKTKAGIPVSVFEKIKGSVTVY